MKSLYLIIFAVVAITFFSCTKDDGVQYTIKGKLLKSCDNPEPIAGQNLMLENYVEGSRNKYETIATTTTDENGAFSISYSSLSSSTELNLKPQVGGFAYLGLIPKNQNIEVNIHHTNNFFYVIKIKTEKVYTEQDTLFYTIGPQQKYITGPFNNNQAIDTVVMSSMQAWGENGELKTNVQYIWKLGSRYNDPTRGNVVNTNLIACKKYNEVVLDLTKAIK